MRFLNSLTFKIGGIVIAIEVLALAAMGLYFDNRFREQVDRRVVQNVQAPGRLMERGLLSYDAVADQTIMRQLVGEELVDGMVVGVNGNVFHALNPDDLGKDVASIPGINSNWFEPTVTQAIVEKIVEGKDTYLVSITPLFAVDGKTSFLFAYIKAKTNEAEAEKKAISWLFIIGVTLSVVLTSTAILISFQGIILTGLKDLLAVVRCVEVGDLTARAVVTNRGELDVLANAFNSMTMRLRELIDNLEKEVTERKRVEVELDKHRKHLEELVRERTAELEIARNKAQQYLDIAGVILVAIDSDRRVTLINQKGCEVLGGAAGEIIGKDWFETFIPANIRQDVIQAFHRLMAGEIEPGKYFENPVLTQGGEERLVAWHNALLRDSEGNITTTLSSGEDITEQRRAEKQIINLNQDLKKRAAALEAANKELDAFAYSVSHDLRAPLRHIDGFMELLQKKAGIALDEQDRHYMDTISGAANKMGLLIDDLLSFSRMGRHAMSFQPVDLGALVHDVVRELEADAAGRTIEWRINDLPAVEGDAAMLRMVLINLISNALKFTRPVQQAEIEIGSLPDTNTETIIFVRDNGVGFDMTYVDKLFGVFQRLHRADEFEGTGIGLANVRRIIARHGGRTWAEGEVDQGATFYFSLPQAT